MLDQLTNLPCHQDGNRFRLFGIVQRFPETVHTKATQAFGRITVGCKMIGAFSAGGFFCDFCKD